MSATGLLIFFLIFLLIRIGEVTSKDRTVDSLNSLIWISTPYGNRM